ncbi:hypothetical protein ACODYM_28695 [Burkholderia gladioli]|uniref:hypothetical protein n=1 Tax=Burkholderia gladioli TaxID=28095 RepID=UPI003B5056FA
MATFAEKLAAKVLASKAALAAKKGTAKLKPGNNRIVLLQGWEEGAEENFYQKFGQHYIKDAEGNMLATAVCNQKTYDLPCPVCSAIQAAGRVVDDATIEVLKEAGSAQGYLLNVLLPESDTPNAPQIVEVRESVLSGILEIVDQWGADAFANEIIIKKEGTGLNTKYSVTYTPKKAAVPADALKQLHNLSAWVKAKEGEEKTSLAKLAVNRAAGLISDGTKGSDTPRTSTNALTGPASAAGASGGDVELEDVPKFDRVEPAAGAAEPTSGGVSLDEELADLLQS